jgi:tRNA threonylcarbamoyladenosine biosynthesis protein TsaE
MHVTRTGNTLKVDLDSEDETARLGHAIALLVEPGVVIGLIGRLGAGKTRLARAVAEALGVDPAAISSPTFVLIQEYEGCLPVYHFDAYRLQSLQAFEDLGVTDYWDCDGVCLVEWADRVRGLLPEDCWMISLETTGPMARAVRVELPASAAGVADRLVETLKGIGSREAL